MPNPPTFTPNDWYWIVAGSTTQVYSSAIGDYVAPTNSTYQTWLAAVPGRTATPIASEEELGEVLAPYFLRPVPATLLDFYKDKQAVKLTIEVVAKVLFNIVNEIRVLKGQSTITAAQFKEYVKGLM